MSPVWTSGRVIHKTINIRNAVSYIMSFKFTQDPVQVCRVDLTPSLRVSHLAQVILIQHNTVEIEKFYVLVSKLENT